MIRRNPASFRDPSGYVLEDADAVYRVIRPAYADEWRALRQSGFPHWAGGMIPFEELDRQSWPAPIEDDTVAVLRSAKLPFISYPYEWSFSQLRDAAIQTLDLHLAALDHGFVLKDASAYNVQFLDGSPIFLDLLSFERLRPGTPWEGYGQFCSHFLAPLALMCQTDVRLGLLSRQWIDGIPLDLAAKLLPLRSRISPGIAMHLHMHAFMRTRHAETGLKARGGKNINSMGIRQLKDVAQSLRRTVAALPSPLQKTEWGDYYEDTNYTPQALKEKERIVSEVAKRQTGKLALDLGANNGKFSRLIAPSFGLVLATDADHTAVEYNWTRERIRNVLPLVLNLASPSPATGWVCSERASFSERCEADFVSALALCHHLRITGGIPVDPMADGISPLVRPGGTFVMEFVPKADSQVKRLLAHRCDIFDDYTIENFIHAFGRNGFAHEEEYSMPDTSRTIHIFRKRLNRQSFRPCR